MLHSYQYVYPSERTDIRNDRSLSNNSLFAFLSFLCRVMCFWTVRTTDLVLQSVLVSKLMNVLYVYGLQLESLCLQYG